MHLKQRPTLSAIAKIVTELSKQTKKPILTCLMGEEFWMPKSAKISTKTRHSNFSNARTSRFNLYVHVPIYSRLGASLPNT